jgi:hypothetical protein
MIGRRCFASQPAMRFAISLSCAWVQTAVVWLVQLSPYAVPLLGEQSPITQTREDPFDLEREPDPGED